MRRAWLTALALLVSPALASAEGTIVKQATCLLSWEAPQVNTDGSVLTNLKEYGVYITTTATQAATPTVVIPSPALDPAVGAVVSWPCSGLPIGQKYAQVDAVNTNGVRGPRTALLPFELVVAEAPGAPGVLSISMGTPDATGVPISATWSPGSGATGYKWSAGFNDGSAPQSGTTTTTSVSFKMPYHASGLAATGFLCVTSTNSGGDSATNTCATLDIPAKPVLAPVSPMNLRISS